MTSFSNAWPLWPHSLMCDLAVYRVGCSVTAIHQAATVSVSWSMVRIPLARRRHRPQGSCLWKHPISMVTPRHLGYPEPTQTRVTEHGMRVARLVSARGGGGGCPGIRSIIVCDEFSFCPVVGSWLFHRGDRIWMWTLSLRGPNLDVNPFIAGTNLDVNPFIAGTEFRCEPFHRGDRIWMWILSLRGPNLDVNPFIAGTNLDLNPFTAGTELRCEPFRCGDRI